MVPPTTIPHTFTIENYFAIFHEIPLLRYFLNSIIFTLGQLIPGVLCVSLTGYVLAKMRFVGRKVLLIIIISTMMVPLHTRLIPLYRVMLAFNWIDTYQAVIIPGIVGPFGVFIFRQSFLSTPDEMIDSAKIEGCGAFRIYWQIALQLIKATTEAYIIFSFLTNWTDFLWPLIVIHTELLKPLEVGLLRLMGMYYTHFGKVMAGCFFSILPVIIVYMFMQKQFVKGIALTGLKG